MDVTGLFSSITLEILQVWTSDIYILNENIIFDVLWELFQVHNNSISKGINNL